MNARRVLLLVLGICLLGRLWGVAAPLTGVHAWRQCDTAAVARNFAQEGMNPLYPRVDWRGDGPGYVEMEFPAFQYAAALIYRVVGVREWVGRLLAALGGVVTCWYVFRLVAWTSGERVGLWSAAVFAVLPLNVYYGRAFMPESWMLAASALGVFHFARWRESRRNADFALAAFGVGFACLLKLPTLYLGLPLLWLVWKMPPPGSGGGETRRSLVQPLLEPRLWLFALMVLIPVGAWYGWAHLLGRQTGLSFGVWTSDKFAAWSLTLSPEYWYDLVFRKIFERHLTWAGTVLFLIGILRPRRSEREWLFDAWTIAIMVYFAIVAKGNRIHEYYQLPLAIPAAFYCGRALAMVSERGRRLSALFCGAVLLLSVGRMVEYEQISESKGAPMRVVAADIAARGLNSERIIVVSGKLPGDPSVLYLANAKGWAVPAAALTRAELGRLYERGGAYVCGVRESFASEQDLAWLGDLLARSRVIRDDGVGFIVQNGPD